MLPRKLALSSLSNTEWCGPILQSRAFGCMFYYRPCECSGSTFDTCARTQRKARPTLECHNHTLSAQTSCISFLPVYQHSYKHPYSRIWIKSARAAPVKALLPTPSTNPKTLISILAMRMFRALSVWSCFRRPVRKSSIKRSLVMMSRRRFHRRLF